MKRILSTSIIAIFAAIVLNVTSALSADKESKPMGGATAMNPQQMQQMQQSMMKMHDLMHQIQAAKTPEERQKLQQQHMQLMQAHMQMMMQGMGGQQMPMDYSSAPVRQ